MRSGCNNIRANIPSFSGKGIGRVTLEEVIERQAWDFGILRTIYIWGKIGLSVGAVILVESKESDHVRLHVYLKA